MYKNKLSLINLFLLANIFLLKHSPLYSTHNTSKYFPFLERPEEYILQGKSHISPEIFYVKASTAFKRGGGNGGIPELWGRYYLNDVIASLQEVKGIPNPIEIERGPNNNWLNKSIRFKVNGKIKAIGLILNNEQILKNGFQIGANIPFMHVNSSHNFALVPQDSDYVFQNLRDGEASQLDRIRRQINKELGLNGGDWIKTGFGDLDLHARYSKDWNYFLKMRKINFNFQTGFVVPTGVNSDNNYASSVSYMGNGHWTWYLDFVPEFELKQDWNLGFMFGMAYQFENTRKLRIPVYQEPAIFSALVTNVKIEPGMTFKVSPYFTLGNLSDGLDFHVRYTYLRHNKDKWYDKRNNPTIKSYLNQVPGNVIGSTTLTEENINNNIKEKENLSLWRAHYITLQFSYNSKEAGNKWILDPTIYALLDYQFSGNGSCKTHQFSVGVELHF
ncbi:hypothetical protein GF322_03535 [Candidatus Dependentiae bacterium]|nr:hypothetical protein [Candidatus Dependentiae bacterium]